MSKDLRGAGSSRRPPTVASWHSSEKYRGVSRRNDLYTKSVSLY